MYRFSIIDIFLFIGYNKQGKQLNTRENLFIIYTVGIKQGGIENVFERSVPRTEKN